MLELVLLGGFAAYNMATTHSDDHTSQQGDRKIDCYDIWHQITTGPGTGSPEGGRWAAAGRRGGSAARPPRSDAPAGEGAGAWPGGGSEAAQSAGGPPRGGWMEDRGTNQPDAKK